MKDWYIEGVVYANCICAYGCPCQFYAPPTYDKCEGLDVLDIEEGYFGDIDLGGIRVLMLTGWPGAIFASFSLYASGSFSSPSRVSVISNEVIAAS